MTGAAQQAWLGLGIHWGQGCLGTPIELPLGSIVSLNPNSAAIPAGTQYARLL